MTSWSKTIGGDFDRIVLTGQDGQLTLEMRVGYDVERVQVSLRSEEAVRDLHFALGRYLAHIGQSPDPESYRVAWYDRPQAEKAVR
ncbi:hypothetical protein ABCW43_00145 [Neorhizobium sp. IRAMC:178]|uniref:hypothetical protein n=1 Tax=Neorhizobium tunisiense TaxID=3144793 RepID=UPI0031F5F3A8